MFRSNQIYSTTEVARNIGRIMPELVSTPQAILIRRERGDPFVLVNASIFEDLMDFRCQVVARQAEARRIAAEFAEGLD